MIPRTGTRLRVAHPALRALALVLAVLLPFEAAHCMWMSPPAAAKTASSTDHACCAGPGSESESGCDSTPAPPPQCPCLELPPAALSLPVVTPPLERVSALVPAIAVLALPSSTLDDRKPPRDESPPDLTAPQPLAPRGPPALA